MQVQAADMNVSSVCSVGSILTAGDRITFESADYDEYAFEYFVPRYMGDMSTNYYSEDRVERDDPDYYIETVNTISKWIVCDVKVDDHVLFICLEPYSGNQSSGSCQHDFEWITYVEPTPDSDGLAANKCKKCEEIKEFAPLSAYGAFQNYAVKMITNAKAGTTVTISTEIWTSFTKRVMEILASRRDVNLELLYTIDGKKYRIFIPADAIIPTDVPYAGFDKYLAGLFGKEEITK